MPYITASIILQLLTVVYWPLAKLQKEGELGRRKITQWTRYLTVVLSAVQSFGIAISLTGKPGRFVLNPARVHPDDHADPDYGQRLHMWLGEQITERGIGNGMSLLIFAGIVVGLPRGIADLYDKVRTNAWGAFTPCTIAMLLAVMMVGGRIHRLCGTQRTANTGAVCQARGGPPGDGRAVDALAAARQHRRCDAGDFRVFDLDVSADRRLSSERQSLFGG